MTNYDQLWANILIIDLPLNYLPKIDTNNTKRYVFIFKRNLKLKEAGAFKHVIKANKVRG